jgi:poly(A) polymerase
VEKIHGVSGAADFSPRTHGELLKFGCLLHDLGKPECRREKADSGKVVFHGHEMAGVRLIEAIAERLRLSNPEHQFLQKIVKNHMRPGVMVQEGLGDRRLFRYYSETGRDGVAIALLSLADRLAAKGTQSTEDLEEFTLGIRAVMDDFYKQMEYARQAPLLGGTDLMTHFQLSPGPRFRELLEAVKEAQHLGSVRDRNEALELVARLLSEKA